MHIADEMASFVQLRDMVQEVQLSNAPDGIVWRWMTYTAKSVYNAQFL
jgi:hypothetical protein